MKKLKCKACDGKGYVEIIGTQGRPIRIICGNCEGKKKI